MKILTVAGTRPEDLKLAPVEEELRERGHSIRCWRSGQSPDLTDEEPDLLAWRIWEDGLEYGISQILNELTSLLRVDDTYDCLLVVGDTATAFAGAVAGFLVEVPVGHVEAGLRTYEREPWPEEAFRGAIARFADFHFAPSQRAAEKVYSEINPPPIYRLSGITQFREEDDVYITGNPSIDALGGSAPLHVVATFHRRENWGERIENALSVLHGLAEDDLFHPWVFTHPNWTEALSGDLSRFSNIHFCDPTSHDVFLDEIEAADIVVTDSGGVQEECAALGTDCLVYRTSTERKALQELDAVELIDPRKPEQLRERLSTEIRKRTAYGRGDAAEKIVDVLEEELG